MLKILVNFSRKVPDREPYSSRQASVSLEGEIANGYDPSIETARLFAQAESAVDRQLAGPKEDMPGAATSPRSTSAVAPQSATGAPPAAPRPQQQATRGYPRRGPAPITDSQLRLIERLVGEGTGTLQAICSQYEIGALRDLSCKAASALIDSLKHGAGQR